MRIRVDEIPESGRVLRFQWDEEKLQELRPSEDPDPLELARPVEVNLEIQRRPDHVHVKGDLRAEIRFSCHRCLEPVSRSLEEPLEAFLIHEPSASRKEEVELDAEELEEEFYDGEAIEIDRLVAERIFLAVPVKALCSEACRGLCPRCGANLNREACLCEREEKPSPFQALAGLKKRLPR